MVDLLEDAIRRARLLPAKVQEDIAHVVLSYMGVDLPVVQLTPD